MYPLTGLNAVMPITDGRTIPAAISQGNNWQRIVVGNVDPAASASPPIISITNIDYHSLGPIYCFNEVLKNKQQLDVMKHVEKLLWASVKATFIMRQGTYIFVS